MIIKAQGGNPGAVAGAECLARRLRLTRRWTGAAEADFTWFLPVLRGGPLTRGVRFLAVALDLRFWPT
jgi:hypothetical protein